MGNVVLDGYSLYPGGAWELQQGSYFRTRAMGQQPVVCNNSTCVLCGRCSRVSRRQISVNRARTLSQSWERGGERLTGMTAGPREGRKDGVRFIGLNNRRLSLTNCTCGDFVLGCGSFPIPQQFRDSWRRAPTTIQWVPRSRLGLGQAQCAFLPSLSKVTVQEFVHQTVPFWFSKSTVDLTRACNRIC